MDKNLIRAFVDVNEIALKKMYDEHRSVFLGFGRKYNVSDEVLSDIYQESFLALRKHALSGRLYDVKSSLRTYLFGIGKYLIYNELKRINRFVPLELDVNDEVSSSQEIEIEERKELSIEQRLLQRNFRKLGKKCQQMLTLFYYRGLTIDEIVEKAGYNSNAVARSQKSRCLKSLREYVNSLKE